MIKVLFKIMAIVFIITLILIYRQEFFAPAEWIVLEKLGTGYIKEFPSDTALVEKSRVEIDVLHGGDSRTLLFSDFEKMEDSENEVLFLDYDLDINDSTIKTLTSEAAEKNKDTVGWIYIPNTRVNYPIMYRKEESNFYLDHDSSGKLSSSGAIFLDDSSNGRFGSLSLVHGHSMKNKTMFGELLSYKNQAWADTHSQIFIFDGVSVKEYEVFACVLINANNEELAVRFSSDMERDMYFNRMIGRSKLAEKEIMNPNDVLVLNTCSYEADNFRCLIFASCVKKNGR